MPELNGREIAQELNKEDLPDGLTLSQEEVVWLRAALQPGTCLYRIVKNALDDARRMRDTIAAADLSLPEGIELARRLQAEQRARVEICNYLLSFANINSRQEPSNG